MRELGVSPGALTAAACRYDAVAAALAQVLQSVQAHGWPDTGRPETAAQVAAAVDGFHRALRALGTVAVADADALSAAAAGYSRVDATAVRAG